MTAEWYRFVDWRSAPPLDEWENPVGTGKTEVAVLKFTVVRVTPKGVRLRSLSGERFVLTAAKKRFACPSVEEARESFLARKQRQIAIYTARIQQAKEAIELSAALHSKEAGR